MSRNIEIEAKSMISKEDYEKLFSKYSHQYKPYEQTNYLLNTKDIPLSDSKLALRIRVKKNDIELTLKLNQGEGKLEINQKLTKQQFELIQYFVHCPKGEVYDELVKMNIDPSRLEVFAVLETIRMDIPGEDYLISIDKSKYLGTTDYEVECESSSMDKAEQILKSFLEKENIPYARNTISKLKRVKNKLI